MIQIVIDAQCRNLCAAFTALVESSSMSVESECVIII